jgi:hypothetical protein
MFVIQNPHVFNPSMLKLDYFIIDEDDRNQVLDYASIKFLNVTIDKVVDPELQEYRIFQFIENIHFLHEEMNVVCLDIKPENIFVGERGVETFNNAYCMDLNTALVLVAEDPEQKYLV